MQKKKKNKIKKKLGKQKLRHGHIGPNWIKI